MRTWIFGFIAERLRLSGIGSGAFSGVATSTTTGLAGSADLTILGSGCDGARLTIVQGARAMLLCGVSVSILEFH